MSDDGFRQGCCSTGFHSSSERQYLLLFEQTERHDLGIRGLPSVRVPVLSKAMERDTTNGFSALPPLISKPRRVATARPDAICAGVESTSAQGQAINKRATR